MTRDSITHEMDLTGRLKDVEHFTARAARREAESVVVPITDAASARIPAPRRSRVFLRSGGGHGTFAELTLAAPRRALD